MDRPQIERRSETNKRTACCFAAGRAWEAQRRNWTEVCTGDESRVLWKNVPKECTLSLDDRLPERVCQTIETEKSMLTVFSIRMASLLWIFCHKETVALENTSMIRYWGH
jgi:hypothetical protein